MDLVLHPVFEPKRLTSDLVNTKQPFNESIMIFNYSNYNYMWEENEKKNIASKAKIYNTVS